MIRPWLPARDALAERLRQSAQVETQAPEVELPPYLESFLAHLRLLVGVPFQYLVPDARLLPDESIRFFYLDRSWSDRLVDGAIAVGKTGSRELAHYQAHASSVHGTLDRTERAVRPLQRRVVTDFGQAKMSRSQADANIATGFLLRSALVSGWPHIDVRAYREPVPGKADPALVVDKQLETLRLERLSPSVMIGLWEGVPAQVVFDEPSHGVQFGVRRGGGQGGDTPQIYLRKNDGWPVETGGSTETPVDVPMRPGGKGVVDVAALRRAIEQRRQALPEADRDATPPQRGGGSFALEVLLPPWRQRFEGTVDEAQEATQAGDQVAVRPWLVDGVLRARVARLEDL